MIMFVFMLFPYPFGDLYTHGQTLSVVQPHLRLWMINCAIKLIELFSVYLLFMVLCHPLVLLNVRISRLCYTRKRFQFLNPHWAPYQVYRDGRRIRSIVVFFKKYYEKSLLKSPWTSIFRSVWMVQFDMQMFLGYFVSRYKSYPWSSNKSEIIYLFFDETNRPICSKSATTPLAHKNLCIS